MWHLCIFDESHYHMLPFLVNTMSRSCGTDVNAKCMHVFGLLVPDRCRVTSNHMKCHTVQKETVFHKPAVIVVHLIIACVLYWCSLRKTPQKYGTASRNTKYCRKCWMLSVYGTGLVKVSVLEAAWGVKRFKTTCRCRR